MESQLNSVDTNPVPACQVCGRQDETLRAISYPYVISAIVMTFWRAFGGIWCQRHRRRYLLVASFITSFLGWLGIPYGIISTPVVLFKLARGGNMNPVLNFQLLNALAEHRLLRGDPQGAIRCFEESLRFQDSPEVRQKLMRLYQQYRPSAQHDTLAMLTPFVAVPALFVMVTIIGLLIGGLDIIIVFLLSPFFGSTESIFVIILSWLPLVLMMFFGILLIRSRTEWTLKKMRTTNQALALALACLAAAFGFYSMLEGRALINALPSLFAAYAFSMNDLSFGIRATLSYGGLLELINLVQIREPFAIIYLLLFSTGAFCLLSAGLATALEITRWQVCLAEVRKSIMVDTETSTALAWMWLAGIVGAALVFGLLLSPGKFVNVAKANEHLANAAFAADQKNTENAVLELRQATSIWPDSVRAHVMLGFAELGRTDYDLALQEAESALQLDPDSTFAHLLMATINISRLENIRAIDHLKFVVAAQPSWAMPHAYLALLYSQDDQTALMQQELEIALAHEAGDGQASFVIGAYYLANRDLEKAEMHILKATQQSSTSSVDYFLLARVYALERKFELAEDAIEKAASLDAKEDELHLAKASLLIQKEDLENALSEIRAALKISPNNSEAHSDLSYVYFLQGNINDAAKEADFAITRNPYYALAYVDQAFAYHAQGRNSEALGIAEQAVKYAPKIDLSHYILAVCYMDSGRKQEAVQEFNKFLELYMERAFVAQYKEKTETYLAQLQE